LIDLPSRTMSGTEQYKYIPVAVSEYPGNQNYVYYQPPPNIQYLYDANGQPLQPQPEESIEMDSFPQDEEQQTQEAEPEPTVEIRYVNKAGRCQQFCSCLGVCCTTCILLVGIVVAAYWFAFMGVLHNCEHPKHKVIEEWSINTQDVRSLDIRLTTGFIKFKESKLPGPNVTMIITKGAKHAEYLGRIKSEFAIEGNRARFHAQSDSFSFHHCQLVKVEVILPLGLTGFDITGHVETGEIKVRAPTVQFGSVDLFSHTGAVFIKGMQAQKDVTIQTKLGAVKARRMKTLASTSFSTETGAVSLRHMDSHQLKVYADTGAVFMGDIVVQEKDGVQGELNALCEWGNMQIVGVRGNGKTKISAETDTGALHVGVSPDEFKGEFSLGSESGSTNVVGFTGQLQQDVGQMKAGVLSASDPVNHIVMNLKSQSGAITLAFEKDISSKVDGAHKHWKKNH